MKYKAFFAAISAACLHFALGAAWAATISDPASLSALVDPPSFWSVRTYTLSMDSNGNYYFQRPSDDPTGLGPLQMYVPPHGAYIVLNMDSSLGSFGSSPLVFHTTEPSGDCPQGGCTAAPELYYTYSSSSASFEFGAYPCTTCSSDEDVYTFDIVYTDIDNNTVTVDPAIINHGPPG
jgi:hypothetical protein